MVKVNSAEPSSKGERGRRERGSALMEVVVTVPIFVATVLGLSRLNRTVQANRIVDRAIGEALLQHAIEGEIPGAGGGQMSFAFKMGDDSGDNDELNRCDRSGARCRVAGDVSLKLVRAIRASLPQAMDERVMRDLVVTLTYADLSLGNPAEYTIPNGLLTIRVNAAVLGGVLSSATVSRTEVVG